MKDKLDDLLAGKMPNDTAYRRLKDFPDQLGPEDAQLASFSRNQRATEKEMAVSVFIRYWVRHQILDNDKRGEDSERKLSEQVDIAENDIDEVMDDVQSNDASEDNGNSSEEQRGNTSA